MYLYYYSQYPSVRLSHCLLYHNTSRLNSCNFVSLFTLYALSNFVSLVTVLLCYCVIFIKSFIGLNMGFLIIKSNLVFKKVNFAYKYQYLLFRKPILYKIRKNTFSYLRTKLLYSVQIICITIVVIIWEVRSKWLAMCWVLNDITSWIINSSHQTN